MGHSHRDSQWSQAERGLFLALVLFLHPYGHPVILFLLFQPIMDDFWFVLNSKTGCLHIFPNCFKDFFGLCLHIIVVLLFYSGLLLGTYNNDTAGNCTGQDPFWKLVHNTGCVTFQFISPLLPPSTASLFSFTQPFLDVLLPFLYLTALEY